MRAGQARNASATRFSIAAVLTQSESFAPALNGAGRLERSVRTAPEICTVLPLPDGRAFTFTEFDRALVVA